MPSIQLDSRYKFEGELIFHAKYGQQFKIVSCQIDIPSTKDGLIAYLSGENFPGIGKKTAEDRKSTRLNSSHANISYAVFCLKKKTLLNFQPLSDLAE